MNGRRMSSLTLKGDAAPDEKCWLCRRTANDVREVMGRPTSKELEVERLIGMVKGSKAAFESRSALWTELVPEQLKNIEFGFILKNPEAFKSVEFADELVKTKKFLVDAIVEVTKCARSGKNGSLGVVEFSGKDERQTSLLILEAGDFERRTGRAVDSPGLFEGADLRQGIGILREAGLVYFAIQWGILRLLMEDAMRNRPRVGVSVFLLDGVADSVSLCSVCEGLLKLR
jgi:hypothetical protein